MAILPTVWPIAQAQNAQHHSQTCAAVERMLVDRSRQGDPLDSDTLNKILSGWGRGGMDHSYIMPPAQNQSQDEDQILEVNSDGAAAALAPGQSVLLGSQADTVQEYYYSRLWGGYTLLSCYHMGDLYAARARSLRRYLMLEAAMLAGAAAVSLWLARRITAPLAVLTKTTAQIAAGDYRRRTALKTGDEVEQLSASFDRMAEAVQTKVDELEQSVQQREDFMAAFTHELKTPMTSIIGYADLLRTAQTDPAEQQEAADSIYREGKRLEALSFKLLALLGLGESKIDPQPTPMPAVLARLRQACPGVALQMAPCTAVVRADADLLLDLLYNLVQNAAKASAPGQPIRVQCTPAGARLQIAVADTGCGIPPQALARVMEPFYMVDKSRARRQGGSGLGLALCRRIAAAHGSELQIESAVGQGTTVRFTLPYAPANAPQKGDSHEA